MPLGTQLPTSTSLRPSIPPGQVATTGGLKKRNASRTTVSGKHGMRLQLSSK